jgi:hypothetical protein
MRSKITHVAIRFRGKVYSLPSPNRHHHVIRAIIEELGPCKVDAMDEDQGFLDEEGNYLNRKQALVSALENNQVKNPNDIRCGMLFSEDVW